MSTKALLPNQCEPLHAQYGAENCCLCELNAEIAREKEARAAAQNECEKVRFLLREEMKTTERLRAALAACGRLCAEVQDWADRLADGDDLTLDECLEYSARCERIAQAWMPPPTPEEQAAIDEIFRKDMEKNAPSRGGKEQAE